MMRFIKLILKLTLCFALFFALGQLPWGSKSIENHYHNWANSRAVQIPIKQMVQLPIWREMRIVGQDMLQTTFEWWGEIWHERGDTLVSNWFENDSLKSITQMAVKGKQDLALTLKKYDGVAQTNSSKKASSMELQVKAVDTD